MSTITFTVPGEPMSKARARVVNGHAFTPERTRVAEAGVLQAFQKVSDGWNPAPDMAFEVQADFYNGTRHRRDIDNMVKLILDALNKHAWADDVLVVGLAARKLFVSKAEARTVVRITQVTADLSHTKPCEHCAKAIKFYSSTTPRWCSNECRRAEAALAHTQTCKHCSKTFWSRGIVRPAIYCSMVCKQNATRVEQNCIQCDAPCSRPTSWVQNGRPFCKPECRVAYWRNHRTIHARGVCALCGEHTSKKSAQHCQPCAILHKATITARAAS